MCVDRQYDYKKSFINIFKGFLIYTKYLYDSYDYVKILVETPNKLNKFMQKQEHLLDSYFIYVKNSC